MLAQSQLNQDMPATDDIANIVVRNYTHCVKNWFTYSFV